MVLCSLAFDVSFHLQRLAHHTLVQLAFEVIVVAVIAVVAGTGDFTVEVHPNDVVARVVSLAHHIHGGGIVTLARALYTVRWLGHVAV